MTRLDKNNRRKSAWHLRSSASTDIKFHTDRMPVLHKVILNFGTKPQPPVRIPTVDDPRWTGDFYDDTPQIILARALFGEARNTLVPDEARIAIAWVIRNRVESKRWQDTYWEVITTPAHFSSFNTGNPNRPYVEDPLHTGKKVDKKTWGNSYEIAGKVISNKIADPTKGADHFYDDSIETPGWAENQIPTLVITYVNEFKEKVSIFFLKL